MENKKAILILLMLIIMLGSSLAFAEEGVITPAETIETYCIKDYVGGEDLAKIIKRYNLEGKDYVWFANFGGLVETENLNLIETAIVKDYTDGEKFEVMYERYGVKQTDILALLGHDEYVFNPKKTVMEAMYYDWKNGIDNYKNYEKMISKEKISRNYEEMKERYGVTDEFIYWNFEDTFPEKLEGITVEQAIINDWLMGTDYNKIKERFGFNDTWFKQTFKTVGRKHIELK